MKPNSAARYQPANTNAASLTEKRRNQVLKQRKQSVAVIEDDRDLRGLLVAALQRAGYEATGIRDGFEAAEYIAAGSLRTSRQPDIVVSDINLPGFDGLKLLAAIRESHWTIPVILMSSLATAETRRAARNYDAAAFLQKPFSIRDLTDAIDAATHDAGDGEDHDEDDAPAGHASFH